MITRLILNFLSQMFAIVCLGVFILSLAFDQFPPPPDKVVSLFHSFRGMAKQAVHLPEAQQAGLNNLRAALEAADAGTAVEHLPAHNGLPMINQVDAYRDTQERAGDRGDKDSVASELQDQLKDLKMRVKALESLEIRQRDQIEALQGRLGEVIKPPPH